MKNVLKRSGLRNNDQRPDTVGDPALAEACQDEEAEHHERELDQIKNDMVYARTVRTEAILDAHKNGASAEATTQSRRSKDGQRGKDADASTNEENTRTKREGRSEKRNRDTGEKAERGAEDRSGKSRRDLRKELYAEIENLGEELNPEQAGSDAKAANRQEKVKTDQEADAEEEEMQKRKDQKAKKDEGTNKEKERKKINREAEEDEEEESRE